MGEPRSLGPGAFSLAPVTALLFLSIFGSVLTLTAYNWLLRHTTLARASSYVYVNPVVALMIGWLLGGESLAPRVLAAAAILILAVMLIMTTPRAKRASPSRNPLATLPRRV
jgi:drug/metabolite transporter (DMT)-like permease